MSARSVLLTLEKLDKISRKYSQKLPIKFKTLFTLDDIHIPHISLVHIKLDEVGLPQVEEKIKLVIERAGAFEMETGESKRGGYPGYIGIEFLPSKAFDSLRKGLLNALEENGKGLDLQHITLTRLVSEEDEAEALEFLSDPPEKVLI